MYHLIVSTPADAGRASAPRIRWLRTPAYADAARWAEVRRIRLDEAAFEALAVAITRRRRFGVMGGAPGAVVLFLGWTPLGNGSWLIVAAGAVAGFLLASVRATPVRLTRRAAALRSRRPLAYAPASGLRAVLYLSATLMLEVALIWKTVRAPSLARIGATTGILALPLLALLLALRAIARRPMIVATLPGVDVDDALRREAGATVTAAVVIFLILNVAGGLAVPLKELQRSGHFPSQLLGVLALPLLSVATLLMAYWAWQRIRAADVPRAETV